MAPREKRSRMVFDEITQDWVPRFGAGSIKKIQEKNTAIMEEKPKHLEAGMDPFTYAKQEKKIVKEKQNLREIKNKLLADSVNQKESNKDRILGHSTEEP